MRLEGSNVRGKDSNVRGAAEELDAFSVAENNGANVLSDKLAVRGDPLVRTEVSNTLKRPSRDLNGLLHPSGDGVRRVIPDAKKRQAFDAMEEGHAFGPFILDDNPAKCHIDLARAQT